MSVELRGAGGRFRFSPEGWRQMLVMAFRYGWEPAGINPLFHNIDGLLELRMGGAGPDFEADDLFDKGQRVDAEAAARIADALEKALPDIPDHDASQHKTRPTPLPGLPGLRTLNEGAVLNSFEWFSGVGKPYLQDFIVFCRVGAFRVWW